MLDHIHLCLKIPPKFSVSYILGFIKGKVPFEFIASCSRSVA